MILDGIYYAAAAVALGGGFAWLWGWPLILPAVLLAAFFLYFFRDPERRISADPFTVVSPADGRVSLVETTPRGTRISIFLSIFDVHVNRAPIAGRVSNVEYRPGRFLNALNSQCAVENEQNRVQLAGLEGSVEFVQIAGLLARRIVFWHRLGDELRRGQRVGLIKFGSRVDLFLPPAAELLVARGARVRGGSSVLARLPQPAPQQQPAETALTQQARPSQA